MSEIQGAWVPETKAEDDLLLELHEATREAFDAGVDTRDIAACMQFLSAAIVLYGDDSVPGDVGPAVEEKRAQKRTHCPECESVIDDVLVAMGGDVQLKPCGCYTNVDDVPGWIGVD